MTEKNGLIFFCLQVLLHMLILITFLSDKTDNHMGNMFWTVQQQILRKHVSVSCIVFSSWQPLIG